MMYEEEIEELRKEINRLNVEILEKIHRRKEIARQIGMIKQKHGRQIVDRSREKEIYEEIRRLSGRYALESDGVERIFQEIIRLCTDVQLKDLE